MWHTCGQVLVRNLCSQRPGPGREWVFLGPTMTKSVSRGARPPLPQPYPKCVTRRCGSTCTEDSEHAVFCCVGPLWPETPRPLPRQALVQGSPALKPAKIAPCWMILLSLELQPEKSSTTRDRVALRHRVPLAVGCELRLRSARQQHTGSTWSDQAT